MAHKHLHELLQEDQQPFQLKHYIAARRSQLKKLDKNPTKYSLQTVKKQKSIPNPALLCKHACFGIEKSPVNFLPTPSPVSTKSPVARNMFIHIPANTSSLLLEAAMRIQKQKNRPRVKKPQMTLGFGLFGSILKKIKQRNTYKKNENIHNGIMMGKDDKVTRTTESYTSRLSSAGWSESNNDEEEEEKSTMDFETSSSCCHSDHEENDVLNENVIHNCHFCSSPENNLCCSRPLSPFTFALQKSPASTSCRTPEFSSPAASPDKENYEVLANIEQEEDEKEQCSPVSVLDPPFDDDGHECEYEYEDENEDEDDSGIECNYALVQRAQQQLLYKLRRFEKLAELDPIELEKLMLEEEGNDDHEDDNVDDDDSVLSNRDRDFETFASEVTIPFGMKRLVSDLISEEKTETNSSNNREEEVVFGRVCKRLDSWQHVRSDTIDMMVESDLKIELDDWKKFQQQREETALEVELSIFRLLVEELAEEIVKSWYSSQRCYVNLN
ncbi:hypothetical protein P3S68_028968 [Capsicum galapagoense]